MPDIEYEDFVKFSFFKLQREWRLLSDDQKQAGKREFAAVVEELSESGSIRSYSTVGTRADTDFMLLQNSPTIEAFHQTAARLNRTALSGYIDQPHSYLSIRRKSRYKHGGGAPDLKDDYRYFMIYPMVKTRLWYEKSKDERQQMMNDHFRIGHNYPMVKINTTYSFGLDDPVDARCGMGSPGLETRQECGMRSLHSRMIRSYGRLGIPLAPVCVRGRPTDRFGAARGGH